MFTELLSLLHKPTELFSLLRKPLNNDEYRVLGITGVLSVLLGAALGFVAVPRWKGAAIGAIFAIPGSLFVGVLWILLRRLRAEKGASMPRVVVWRVVLVATIMATLMGLRYALPSVLWRTVLVATIAASIGLFITTTVLTYLLCRGGKGDTDFGKPGKR